MVKIYKIIFSSKYNTQNRERNETENRLRVIAGSGALGPQVQTGEAIVEVGEALYHSNIKANTELNNMIYDNCIKNGWTDEQAKELIFERMTNNP